MFNNGFAALLGMMLSALHPQLPPLHLDKTEYIVSDSAKYMNFHLYLHNESDSAVFITRVDPSCGCVLASVQRNRAMRDKPGDVYVAVTTGLMDTLQPITVDVYTTKDPSSPLRLFIRKKPLSAE